MRNINNLRYADDTTLMAESEEKLKNLLVRVKEDSEKAGLKVNLKKKQKLRSGIWSHQFTANKRRKSERSNILFSWAPKSMQTVTVAMKLKGA